MVLQWTLLLEDPFADATMTKLEADVSASPPRLPLFDRALWPAYHPPPELDRVKAVAARCCAPIPSARPSMREVSSLLQLEIETEIERQAHPALPSTDVTTG